MDKDRHFPQYRKIPDGRAMYCILDDRNFYELQRIGTKVKRYVFKAEQYPEILKIQDMLKKEAPYVDASSEEYDALDQLAH